MHKKITFIEVKNLLNKNYPSTIYYPTCVDTGGQKYVHSPGMHPFVYKPITFTGAWGPF